MVTAQHVLYSPCPFIACRQVAVEIAGKRKMTAEAKGEEETHTEETLDFLIGGEVVDREGEMVKVEVWDVTFIASDLVRLAILGAFAPIGCKSSHGSNCSCGIHSSSSSSSSR